MSIGLPVFQGDRYLAGTIESILGQDFADFELVVSDNASTDGTEEIGRHFARCDRRVTYVRHPTNRGAAWNFNYVVAATSGPLFKWAAHDDDLCRSWLGRCVTELDAADDAVLAYTRRVKIDGVGAPLPTNGFGRGSRRFLSADCSSGERFVDFIAFTSACVEGYGLIRRDALEGTRLMLPFPASERVLLAELVLRGRFVEVPDQLFLHRDHPARATRRCPTPVAQARWLDPRRERRVVLPTWRLGLEFGRAIERSSLDRADRKTAYAGLWAWLVHRRYLLVDNVLDAARAWRRPRWC